MICYIENAVDHNPLILVHLTFSDATAQPHFIDIRYAAWGVYTSRTFLVVITILLFFCPREYIIIIIIIYYYYYC